MWFYEAEEARRRKEAKPENIFNRIGDCGVQYKQPHQGWKWWSWGHTEKEAIKIGSELITDSCRVVRYSRYLPYDATEPVVREIVKVIRDQEI